MSNPYRKSVRHLDEIDIYQIGNLYEVKSHAVFHAIKKLLCAGKRGAKDYEQDLMEAIESIERELQMMPVAETREVGGVQECGFKPMHHEGIMPGEDLEPDWDRRHPSLRFSVKDEQGKFVFCKDQPSSGTFWIRPADFDEQRIDVIGQNGNEGEHYEPKMSVGEMLEKILPTELLEALSPNQDDWRSKVDWSLASPHHQWASRKENGDYGFSMHEPMQGEYIRRPVAQ